MTWPCDLTLNDLGPKFSQYVRKTCMNRFAKNPERGGVQYPPPARRGLINRHVVKWRERAEYMPIEGSAWAPLLPPPISTKYQTGNEVQQWMCLMLKTSSASRQVPQGSTTFKDKIGVKFNEE